MNFRFIVFLAPGNSRIKLFDHAVSLVIEIVDALILNRNSRFISFSNAVDH